MTEEPERHEQRGVHRGVESPFASGGPSESQVPAGHLPEQRVVAHDPERDDDKEPEAEEIYEPGRYDGGSPRAPRPGGLGTACRARRHLTRNLNTKGLREVPTIMTSPSRSATVPPLFSPPTVSPSTMVPQVLWRSTST